MDGGIELAQRALPPGEDVLAVDDVVDSDCRRLRDRAVFHGVRELGPLEQVAQLADGRARVGKLRLQSVQMLDDQPVPRLSVGSGQDGLHLGDGHLQTPQPADHLRRWDLLV